MKWTRRGSEEASASAQDVSFNLNAQLNPRVRPTHLISGARVPAALFPWLLAPSSGVDASARQFARRLGGSASKARPCPSQVCGDGAYIQN